MRISLLLCVLLLFSAPSLAEESDGAAMIAIQLAGFVTTHDVAEHSFIDKDIKDMSTEMAKKTQMGYDAALKIYQEGKNSRMQTKARTLDEFWPGMHVNTQGHKATEEPFLKMYDEYEKITKHASAHKGAVAAMQGTDDAQDLGINYATDKNAKTWPFRDQVAKKNIKYQVVMVYALHELEIAVDEYIKNGVTDVAQRYLDVWWAFYVGSQEYGSGDGYCPYALAEKRSKFFQTDTAMIGNGGTSKVNDILLKATMEISKLMRGAGNNDKIKNIMKCVRAQLKVPLIQGCIQYGYKTDPATAFEPSTSYDSVTGYNSEHARKGELWSFCSGVLPFLHQADPAKAAALLTAVDVKTMADRYPQWQDVKAVFDGATLNKMGVKCSDIGGFADKNADKTSATTLGSDFTACSAESPNNADADSGQCVGDWAVGNNVADTKGGVKPENTVPSPVAGSAGATTPHFFPLLVASFVISRIFWHGVF